MSEGLLREHIEQAVGPVRASRARKDRMREELAAHLAASLEEERARGGDEHDAAQRALRRLGDSGTLSRSLDESVPWQERMLFAPIPVLGWLDELERAWSRRKHESLFRHASRLAIAMATAISVAEVIAITVVIFTTRRPTNWRVALVWGVQPPVFVASGTFVYAALVRRIDPRPGAWEAWPATGNLVRRALERGHIRRCARIRNLRLRRLGARASVPPVRLAPLARDFDVRSASGLLRRGIKHGTSASCRDELLVLEQ